MDVVTMAMIGASVYASWKLLTRNGTASTSAAAPSAGAPPVAGSLPDLPPDAPSGYDVAPTGAQPQPPPLPASNTPPPSKVGPAFNTTSDGKPLTTKNISLLPSMAAPSDAGAQWYWVVQANQSPAYIAAQVTRRECDYLELLDANPSKPTVGPRACYKINFTSLQPGEVLALPRSWNSFISKEGYRRGDGQPWTGAS